MFSERRDNCLTNLPEIGSRRGVIQPISQKVDNQGARTIIRRRIWHLSDERGPIKREMRPTKVNRAPLADVGADVLSNITTVQLPKFSRKERGMSLSWIPRESKHDPP